jgi:hypothetical protein
VDVLIYIQTSTFHGLAEKLGTTTIDDINIHAPVPGFEDQLEKVLNRTFTALQVMLCRHHVDISVA